MTKVAGDKASASIRDLPTGPPGARKINGEAVQGLSGV